MLGIVKNPTGDMSEEHVGLRVFGFPPSNPQFLICVHLRDLWMKIPTAIAQEVASADFTDWRRWNP
jgi:hypothetical protein